MKQIFIVLLLFLVYSCNPVSEKFQNWDTYLGDKSSSQYSSLNQINKNNVKNLEVAWIYNSGDHDSENRSQIQCNPLIIDGILYGSTSALKFFALDAATGRELWKFDPFENNYNMFGMGVNRGLVFWEDKYDKRILFTAGSKLYCLDAQTGEKVIDFGNDGMVDLHAGLDKDADELFVISNSPGVIYKDLLILGTRVSENYHAAPGHIRAYNVRTGDIQWIFHTIPHPGEYGYDTWPEDAYLRVGGANAWAGMSLDEDRGIVFIPTGSASFDFYGGDRKGKNLFANSLLALDAETGKRIWHFQTVHHDLWDRDLPAPPNLLKVTHNGVEIDAVAQITKTGFVFLFDRETGEPLFPVNELNVPTSDIKGEESWPTQPIPSKPPPFTRQSFSKAEASKINEEINKRVINILEGIRSEEMFTPPSLEGTLIFPGFDGGGEWGGAAHEPGKGILYVNANEMPWILRLVRIKEEVSSIEEKGKMIYMKNCANCHGLDRKGGNYFVDIPSLVNVNDSLGDSEIEEIILKGKGVMPGFEWLKNEGLDAIIAYLKNPEIINNKGSSEDFDSIPTYTHTGYNRFVDLDGNPAIEPPWGTLNAIDMNKGEILWQVPLGEVPELAKKGMNNTGSENYGGPLITAGGLIFIGATKDEKFRVFDKETGDRLFETKLPYGGYATPSTYMMDGRQYVVIACGGGKMGTNSGDAYVAFSLPE